MTNPAFMRIKRFAAASGLPVKTVRRWVQDGTLRSFRSGRTFYIPVSEIDRLAAAPSKPKDDASRDLRPLSQRQPRP